MDLSDLTALDRERLAFVLRGEHVEYDEVRCLLRFPKDARVAVLAAIEEAMSVERAARDMDAPTRWA